MKSDIIHTIETTEIQIRTTYIIDKTEAKIDTTHLIERTEVKCDSTQIFDNLETINIDKKTYSNINIESESDSEKCSIEGIIKNNCRDEIMKNEQIVQVYNAIKDNILTEEYNGEDTVIQTKNVIFEISTLEGQKNNNNSNISSIDLGECENILKEKNNILPEDSLIVLKSDIKNLDLSSTYVQYEIFNPYTLDKLDLSDCIKEKIVVNVPVNLEDITISFYESLNEYGYNLFDVKDDFYTNICSTYTSKNGADMTLLDRKNEVYKASENTAICQTGCKFESYNKTTKKSKCNCEVQINKLQNDITKIDFSTSIFADSFIETLEYSNFLVLKCYKLALDVKNILKNKGRIVMSILYFLFLISFLFYIIKDKKKLQFLLMIY